MMVSRAIRHVSQTRYSQHPRHCCQRRGSGTERINRRTISSWCQFSRLTAHKAESALAWRLDINRTGGFRVLPIGSGVAPPKRFPSSSSVRYTILAAYLWADSPAPAEMSLGSDPIIGTIKQRTHEVHPDEVLLSTTAVVGIEGCPGSVQGNTYADSHECVVLFVRG